MSTSGINFTGLASGLDSASIISATLAADRLPEGIWQNTITSLTNQQTAYNTVSAQLLSFQSTAQTIDGLRSFDLVGATSSAADVATVTAQTGAQTGSHTITVDNLAQSQKIATAAQPSQTAPLGFSGQIVINGKAINISASDSLQTLAGNINSAQPGVSASIISPKPNQFILTLGSTNSGLQGQISISDTSGGSFVGSTLGIFTTGTSIGHVVNGTAAGSDLFADSATSVATLEGLTSIPPAQGSVSITSGGVAKNVLVDLSKSLSGIAGDVNLAFGANVATVATVTDPTSGVSRQQLQLSGVSAPGDLVDSNGVLANLGLIKNNVAVSSQLQNAQDATFNIDGLQGSRPSNTLTDVISGVTISLLRDGTSGSTPATSTLDVSSDTTTIKANIATFVKAFNDTIDSIKSFQTFDATTGKTGALFGDSTASGIVDSLISNVTGQVPGLPSSLSAISQAGISLDQASHLNIDDAALSAALATNLQGVAKLFRSAGTPSDPAIQFVSATGDTQPSGAGSYAVAITQPAQQAIITAGTALVGGLGQNENLTFTGPIFGSLPGGTGGYHVALKQGDTLADIVSLINSDSKLGPALAASIVNGKLTLTSKSYGSLVELAVSSDTSSATPNSAGIGTTLLDQKGIDVAGTINGEAATGNGQFLTGSLLGTSTAPKGLALGLQIRVTATTAGNYGSVSFTSGVADVAKHFVDTQTDGYTGALTTAVAGLQSGIDDNKSSIADLESRLTDIQASMTAQYASLEATVSLIKSSSVSIAQIALPATSG
jgi:flagellar hook-associated protein 2